MAGKKKTAAAAPKPGAAAAEKDKEEKAPVFRVDLGESLPTPPLKTATDKK